MLRTILRAVFFSSEVVLIAALCFSYAVDPRVPKWGPVVTALAVPGISALVLVIVTTFALSRSDPCLTRFGLITLILFLVFGALIPAI